MHASSLRHFGVLVLAFLSGHVVPAAAAVDVTGTWGVTVQTVIGPESSEWTMVQSGTQLTLTYTLPGGTEGPFVGTIDPDTGDFSVPLPASCSAEDGIVGSASASGHTMSGTWRRSEIMTLPAIGCFNCCFDPLGAFTGALLGCGNGALDPGETCDDGNEVGGDCCSADCQVAASDATACTDGDACTTGDACVAGACVGSGDLACAPGEVCFPNGGCEFVCGNGVLDGDEACDDGNLVGGDCCSALCEVAAADGTPCSDGDVCSANDECAAGSCVAGPPLACDPCEVCGPSGCELPATTCQPALAGGKAKLTMKAPVGTSSKNQLKWSWRSSGAVAFEDFGNPTASTNFTLCVIDQQGLRASATAPAESPCGAGCAWKMRSKGWAYKESSTTPDGILTMQLGAGSVPGQGKMSVRAKGAQLVLPSAALTPPVVVRVVRSDAPSCWEATYSTPTVNDGASFKAKSD